MPANNGGSVNATGGVGAADIGGGYNNSNHGTLTNNSLQEEKIPLLKKGIYIVRQGSHAIKVGI